MDMAEIRRLEAEADYYEARAVEEQKRWPEELRQRQLEEALDALAELVVEHCPVTSNRPELRDAHGCMGSSAARQAMEVLIRQGRMAQAGERIGRLMWARFVPQSPRPRP